MLWRWDTYVVRTRTCGIYSFRSFIKKKKSVPERSDHSIPTWRRGRKLWCRLNKRHRMSRRFVSGFFFFIFHTCINTLSEKFLPVSSYRKSRTSQRKLSLSIIIYLLPLSRFFFLTSFSSNVLIWFHNKEEKKKLGGNVRTRKNSQFVNCRVFFSHANAEIVYVTFVSICKLHITYFFFF